MSRLPSSPVVSSISWRPALLCASTAAVLSAGGTGPAQAFDIDGNADLITETIALQELRRDWDPARIYGARPVDEIDRTFAEPEGVRLGNFVFYPAISETAEYDSNIFGSPQDATADWRFITAPTIVMRSQLPRHVLDAAVSARFLNYAESTDQNYVDVRGIIRGALHIDHAHTLSATLDTAREHEERSASTAPRTAAEPVPFARHRASVGLTRDAGRLYGTLSGTVEQLDYESVKAQDGTRLSQDSRDQILYSGQLRTGYRFSPGYEVVSKVRVGRLLNEGEAPGAPDRNSHLYEAMAGLQFELNPLFSWRLIGGYGIRDFDRADLKTVESTLLEARVRWLPTERLSLFAHVQRALVDEIGAADNGRLETTVGARAEYELLHNLVGSVHAEYSDQEFIGTTRQDTVTELGAGLDYLLTKNWHFDLGYAYEQRDSNEADFDFERHRVRAGAKLKF